MLELLKKFKLSVAALVVSGTTLTTCTQCTVTSEQSVFAAKRFGETYAEYIETAPFERSESLDSNLEAQIVEEEGRGRKHYVTTRLWKDAKTLVDMVQDYIEDNETNPAYRMHSATQVKNQFETIAKTEELK